MWWRTISIPGYDVDRAGLREVRRVLVDEAGFVSLFQAGASTFMLMESCPGAVQWRTPQKAKRPGIHRLEMLQAIAHGADGTCYFQFRSGRGSMEKLHGSVVEHWGTERHPQTRRFRELRSLSDTYEQNRSRPRHFGAAASGDRLRLGKPLGAAALHGTGVSTADWRANRLHYYDEVAVEQYENFWQRGIPVDVISNDRDLAPYKLVILPMHWIMTPDSRGRFAPTSKPAARSSPRGTRRWRTRATACCWAVGRARAWETSLASGSKRSTATPTGTPRAIAGLPGTGGDVAALMHLEGATVLATFAEDFYSGQPAVTVNTFGKGRAYFLGTRLDAQARSAFYAKVLDRAGAIEPIIDAELPPGVTAQLRGAGNEAFVFLLNFSVDRQNRFARVTRAEERGNGPDLPRNTHPRAPGGEGLPPSLTRSGWTARSSIVA